MGQVHIKTEITATPAQARQVLFNFPRYPEWHSKFIRSIETIPPGTPPASLKEGDKLRVDFSGAGVLHVLILEINETKFRWRGSSFAGAFAGDHYFILKESVTSPGETTLLHGEDYTGWGTVLFKPGWPLNKTAVDLFEGFSEDLKRRVERLHGKNSI